MKLPSTQIIGHGRCSLNYNNEQALLNNEQALYLILDNE